MKMLLIVMSMTWVALVKETNEYIPIDGFHRLMAVKWLQTQSHIKTDMDCNSVAIRYSEFDTMAEAIIAAAGVNATHGLKRSKGDIANAIRSILDVDRIRFMETPYKLDQKAIMEVVNCSRQTFNQETKELRKSLEASRNNIIKRLAADGVSQREIAMRTGASQSTINRIISDSNGHDGEMNQPEAAQPRIYQDDVRGGNQESFVPPHSSTKPLHVGPLPDKQQESFEPKEKTVVVSGTNINDSRSNKSSNHKSELSDHDLARLLDNLNNHQRVFALNYLSNM